MPTKYDRDLRRLRVGIVGLLLLNFVALLTVLYQRLWVQTFAAGVWTLTCGGWLVSVGAQQRARDWARIHEAGLRELKRQIDRGLV